MAYFYTVATKKEEDNNHMKVFESEFKNRMEAIEDILHQCSAAGYTVGSIYPYKNTIKQGDILTKNIQRKRRNGELNNDAFLAILHWKYQD